MRQEQLAETLGNPVPSVNRNDEDPAQFKFVISRCDVCVRLREDVIPIPFAGHLQGGDRRERVICRTIEHKPFRITNAAMQTLIGALETLAN